jgi:hypothetical protein
MYYEAHKGCIDLHLFRGIECEFTWICGVRIKQRV